MTCDVVVKPLGLHRSLRTLRRRSCPGRYLTCEEVSDEVGTGCRLIEVRRGLRACPPLGKEKK